MHIDYGKNRHSASFAINDGSVLAGHIDNKYMSVIKKWIEDNNSILQELWEDIQTGKNNNECLAKLDA